MESAALLGMQLAVISYEKEESLWKAGNFGVESPKALLNAIFYMNGKVLCLRGEHEYKSLKISQLILTLIKEVILLSIWKMAQKNVQEHTRRRKVTTSLLSIMQIHNLVIIAMCAFCVSIYKSFHPKF